MFNLRSAERRYARSSAFALNVVSEVSPHLRSPGVPVHTSGFQGFSTAQACHTHLSIGKDQRFIVTEVHFKTHHVSLLYHFVRVAREGERCARRLLTYTVLNTSREYACALSPRRSVRH